MFQLTQRHLRASTKMRLLTILVALGITPAFAQLPKALEPTELLAALESTPSQLLVVAPTVANREIADALRRAATQRGTRVFIVASPELVEASYSYVPSLALLAHVQVRLGRVERSFIVAGRGEAALLIEGVQVGAIAAAPDQPSTYSSREASLVGERARLFTSLWRAARPYHTALFQSDPVALETIPEPWGLP